MPAKRGGLVIRLSFVMQPSRFTLPCPSPQLAVSLLWAEQGLLLVHRSFQRQLLLFLPLQTWRDQPPLLALAPQHHQLQREER